MKVPELKYFDILFNLLLLRANEGFVRVTTVELSKKMDKSQQSISQLLISLERDGLIEKNYEKRGLSIKLSQRGTDILMTVYLLMRDAMEKSPNILTFKGTLFSGLAEGAYYMSLPGYQEQFKKKLGFVPFAGTLNLRLDAQNDIGRKQLDNSPSIKIEGFKDGLRAYGGLTCYNAMIENIRGAVVRIERTHYDPNIIEIIAPVNLRKALKLKDGDEIAFKVFL
ncbi:MAG: CTP-dependent riboflavin kinase [Nitrososphaerota archaeon]|jgi:riboflavin kinase|nr:CTP-dependent riboflavin kinase [Nitrososphaerota archaeon]MDG7036832.1 CTP-dependent riboflavin kinase [Nitrososphaerota archaeon]MDG7039285.1 CTP-dependent riboflavin kinase [Nitrososphaerota archaeon]MDG7044665.1 CTP-dependent riboflavin kinase [Nitrososphaerota archaeon]MDG7045671.1 CTP-dependent riboflavin kinase [Nitrososphaerota archaeon]